MIQKLAARLLSAEAIMCCAALIPASQGNSLIPILRHRQSPPGCHRTGPPWI